MAHVITGRSSDMHDVEVVSGGRLSVRVDSGFDDHATVSEPCRYGRHEIARTGPPGVGHAVMSEYESRERGRSHDRDVSYASPSHASNTPAPRTPAEQARDEISYAARVVNSIAGSLEAVRRAHAANDPARWREARGVVDRDLASAEKDLARARTRTHDAEPEAREQLAVAEAALAQHVTAAASLVEAPRGWKPVAREAELLVILRAPADGAVRSAFAHKEAELKAELARLSPAESHHLMVRLNKRIAGDPVAAAIALLVPERRARLVSFLGDARRRAALTKVPIVGTARVSAVGTNEALATSSAVGSIDVSSATPTVETAHVSIAAATNHGAEPVSFEMHVRHMIDTREPDLDALAAIDGTRRRAMARQLEAYRLGSGDPLGARYVRLDREVRQRLLDALLGSERAEAAVLTKTEREDPARMTAAVGFAGPSQELPHLAIIQKSFGRHDVRSVDAHVGGTAADAARAIGARAYTSGPRIAFAAQPDLHTAAHEAAHVIQQQHGVVLPNGLDTGSDAFEQHADRVADAVVRGESVEHLLGLQPSTTSSSSGGGTVVQRKSTTAETRPTVSAELAPGVDFEVLTDGVSARVRRDWLRAKPFQHYLAMFKAMRAVNPAIAHATDADLERLAGRSSPLASEGANVVRYTLDVAALAIIGLAKDARPVVERVGQAYVVALRVPNVAAGPSGYVDLAPDQLDVVYEALNHATGLQLQTKILLSAQLQSVSAGEGPHDGTLLLAVGPQLLDQMFGRQPAAHPHHEPAPPAAKRGLPSPLSREERARIQRWCSTAGLPTPAYAPHELVELIDELERDPAIAERARILLLARPQRAVDVIVLRSVIERAKIELERARLGLVDPVAPGHKTDVASHADLPMRLVERSLIVPDRPTKFLIAIDWSQVGLSSGRYALANIKWRAIVEWVFERTDVAGPPKAVGEPIAKPEVVRQEYTSDTLELEHTFTLGHGERRGTWLVHAFVHTSAFAPQHITAAVEVEPEEVRLETLRREAYSGIAPDHADVASHTFDIGVVDRGLRGVRSAAGVLSIGRDLDATGTVTRGWQPANFAARTPQERESLRTKEIEQTRKLIEYLEHERRADNEMAIKVAKERLDHLVASDHEIASDVSEGWTPFELRGTYLSRVEIPSGPLDLYGTVRRHIAQLTPAWVEVQIRDQSQRFSPNNFAFIGRGATFEIALEDAFVDLCKAYPEGRLGIMAQELVVDRNGTRQNGRVLGFELATTTTWKRIKGRTSNPLVQLAINLAATAVMVFQPELAPVIMTALAVNNSLPSVDDLITRRTNGTLTFSSAAIDLADIGMNVLPFAHGAIELRPGAGLFGLEIASHAAQLLVMTEATKQSIAEIQEMDLAALAETYRALLELEKTTNPATRYSRSAAPTSIRPPPESASARSPSGTRHSRATACSCSLRTSRSMRSAKAHRHGVHGRPRSHTQWSRGNSTAAM